MNDIEFRGKEEKTEKWVYGYYVNNLDGTHNILKQESLYPYKAPPETIGQYTGMKDKNGVKIFEGDIVKIFSSPYMNKPAIGKIIRLYGGLWLEYTIPIYNPNNERKAIMGLAAFERTPVEVIGNIHDNPELLKETEND